MDVDLASKADVLWHEMRADLEAIIGGPIGSDRLRCCVCGRLLPRSDFSLEHVVPRQALQDDPAFARAALSASTRSGHLLLCRKPIKLRGGKTWGNGCNGWKGSHYDASLRRLLNRSLFDPGVSLTNRVVISALAAGYLAMVVLYGYQVAFTPAGIATRKQFFSPNRFRNDLPLMSQIILSGEAPAAGPDTLPFWSRPFNAKVEGNQCFIVIRNFSVIMPLSRDPRLPILRHLRFVPERYALRPDFSSLLE